MDGRDYKQTQRESGWTLAELIMVLSLVSMLIIVILPQFRILQKSWDLKEAKAEIQQNGRVLADHLHRELSSAQTVTAISDASAVFGYLEYQDAEGQPRRYEVGSKNYVYFGPPGNLSLLAGPVSRFQISGFAAADLVNPTTNPASIRLVQIQSRIDSVSGPPKTENFSFSVCLRASSNPVRIRLLFVVGNTASLNPYEQRLYNQFISWRYSINLIRDRASQREYDRAWPQSDAAYIPASCGCQNLRSKLSRAPIGVVCEHLNCHDDLWFSNQEGGLVQDRRIKISNAAHPITAPYSIDSLVTVLSSNGLTHLRGSIAGGLRELAVEPKKKGHTVMAIVEVGDMLQGGQRAPGRRVVLPWGDDAFDNRWLEEQGWNIIQRAIEWSAGAI